jgi:uncharacterized protein YjbI with pentapeptide repeats
MGVFRGERAVVLRSSARSVLEDSEFEELPIEFAPTAPDTRILDGLILTNTTVAAFADYKGVTFTGPVTLKDVRFQQGFSFAGATFLGPVKLTGVSNDRIRGSIAQFAGAFFGQTLRARKCTFYLCDFTGVRFEQFADFRGTRFYASAKFDKTQFPIAANFSATIFNGSGNFRQANFGGSCDFERVVFKYKHSHARFNEVQFAHHVGFNQAQFSGSVDYTDAVFKSGVSFEDSRFHHGAAPSSQDSDADVTEENGDFAILFDRVTFRADDDGQTANFKSARFGDHTVPRPVSFKSAMFRPSATEIRAKPSPLTTNFTEMECSGPVDFRDASFSENVSVDFAQTRFADDVDFSGCSFAGDAAFEKCHARGDFLLSQARFARYPNFKQTNFHHHPELSQAILPSRSTTVSRRDRGDVVQRMNVLRRMAQKTDDKKMEYDLLVRELKLEGGFASGTYGLVSKYGQSWLRPAVWLLVFSFMFFPALYLTNGKMGQSFMARASTSPVKALTACEDGSGDYALFAALEHSIRTALVVSAQNEARAGRVSNCLGFNGASSARGLGAVTLEACQTILTLILVFFIGQAVRRRLQMR